MTETWLNEDICEGEVLDNVNYDIYRKDRDLSQTNKTEDDAVLCAVHRNYVSKRRKDFESDIEILWIELVVNYRSIFVATIYFPKPSPHRIYLFDKSLYNVI